MDVSDAGEGWSDGQIIEALETSPSMVYRVRRQLVEEGVEAVLSRKQRAMPAVPRIFDGEKEAKLIALACSEPHRGRACWTLRLLENKVVELLDEEIFYSLAKAKVVIENWRRHYNTVRPHGSLGYKPPAPEVFIPTTPTRAPPQPPPASMPVFAPRPTLN